MVLDKEIRWIGSAYADLLSFPEGSRRQAGFQLGKIQAGLEPDDWKSFDNVGSGIRELRLRERDIVNFRYRAVITARSTGK
ncbi:type II toxin-antitoxin system RelE/ParE family toxin [Achromobacter pestifer]